jgi:hypothetical protein
MGAESRIGTQVSLNFSHFYTAKFSQHKTGWSTRRKSPDQEALTARS